MLPLVLPFLLGAPYGLTPFAFNPVSNFISGLAFNSLGFGTWLLPAFGWS